jgi:predicted outer membrane repeat protein
MKKNLLLLILKNRLLFFLLLCFLGQPAFSAVLYVDGDLITSTHNGQSWATAYSKLEYAIDASQAGDQIWVAKGTYMPVSGRSYYMKNGVTIYGGFVNGAMVLDDRDFEANLTLLTSHNASVITTVNINNTAILDGFTITGNVLNNNYTGTAGMSNRSSSPIIRNVIFKDNISTGSTYVQGGALFNWDSSPILINVKFINNKCISTNGQANGAAIFNQGNGNVTLTNVVFSGNRCESGTSSNSYAQGAAIYNLQSHLTINNVVFIDNVCNAGVSATYGAALYNYEGQIRMSNTVFTGNSAYYGSMIYGYNATYEIVHTTGYQNVYAPSSWYSGFSLIGNSVIKIANSIFMENSAWNIAATTTTDIKNSFFDMGPSGLSNISVANLPFINASNPVGEDGNWFTADDGLQISLDAKVTPINKGRAINTPDYSAVLVDSAKKDILGVSRPKGFANDLGAYEAILNQKVFYVDSANVNGVHDGLSWATAFNKLEDALSQAALSMGNNVWVAKGTYSPPVNQSFKIGRTTAVFGGFTNNSTDFSQRDWKANPTILKGSGSGVIDNDYPNDAGNLSGWAILEGFTITGGNNSKGGAGMYNKYASPDLKNIIFIDNHTTGSGGAFYSEGSGSNLTDVTFKNNTAGADGGAIYVTQISNKQTNTGLIFINNSANRGGAVANIDNTAYVDMINTVFENNYAVYGGAVYNTSVWTLNFTNSVFAGNKADFTAAVHNAGSGRSIYLNVSFSKNTATNNITLASGQGVSPVTNGVFWGNSPGLNNTYFYSCYGQTGGVTSPFVNANLPAGPDGIWRTRDDGIQLKYEAGTISKGNPLNDGNSNLSSSMLNAAKTDILGVNRTVPLEYDLGAYEYVLPNFTRFYVDASNSAILQNGGTWATAYSTLQKALEDVNLEAGDTIYVAKGTYSPLANQSFKMIEGVKMYGGFLNTAADFNERDFKANEAILKGNGKSVISNEFTSGNLMTNNSVLDGFTIMGGKGNGAGIYNFNASPILRNLIIKNNDGSNSSGGGLYFNHSNSALENVIIEENQADFGGGIEIDYNSAPTLKKVLIKNNKATLGGGGIDVIDASVSMDEVVLFNNESDSEGGGINFYGSLNPSVFNNVVFYKNTAYSGAGFNAADGDAKLSNITFAENISSNSGGGLNAIGGNSTVVNSIFWGNTAASGLPDIEGSNFTIDYSFTQEDFTSQGTGNLIGASSPFVSLTNVIGDDGLWFTADDGLLPAKTSPVVNAGSNTAATNILTDITGRGRIFNTIVDMGAYEAYPASDANLSALSISEGTLDPVFSATNTDYEVEVSHEIESILVTATFGDASAKAIINNEDVVVLTSGTASAPLVLPVGRSEISITLKAADSVSVKTYTINIVRAKGDQQINPIATIEKSFGDSDFEPGATATSNLVVNYSSADETIAQPYQDAEDNNKWKIKLLRPGTVNITASQPGNLTYKAAADVVFSLVVSKGLATITLSNLSATYDGTTKTVSASTTPTGLDGISITYNGSATAPINAGTYAVIAKLTNNNYTAADVTGELVISKATATLTLANLSAKYDGTAKSVTVTTTPANLTAISITYDGLATAPTAVGTYAVVVSLNNPNYTATATGDLVIDKGNATITLSNLSATYDGSPKSATASTNPSGLSGLSITYNGSATAPTAAGTYAVVAKLTNDKYTATDVTGNLVIAKASAILYLGASTNVFYDGTPKTAEVTTSPANLSGTKITYNGSTTAPIAVGTYAVVASLENDNYYANDVSLTIKINKGNAELTLSNLSATYDGTAKSVSVSTNPSGLSGVSIMYNGSVTAPTNAGTYAVVAKLTHDGYTATDVTGNLVISKGAQTITFPDFTNKKVNSPDFEPGASVNTGLPLTYTSNDNAVAEVYKDASDGNKWKIRIIGAGAVTITATQEGTSNYESVTVSRILLVEPITLPVSLISYQANKEANRVQLIWTTASERDNDYFEIQRSVDGLNFQRLSVLKAQTSSSNKDYVLYDYSPANGDNYYRLIQYDINGQQAILGDRIVNFNIAAAVSVSVFPNPTVDEVNLSFTGFPEEAVNVSITDLSGRIVHRETVRLAMGETVYRLALEKKLIPGQYIITVNDESLKASLKLLVAR